MTIGTYIQAQIGSATDATTAVCSITTRAGSTLVAIASLNQFYGSTTTTGVTDSAGNTWTSGNAQATFASAGDSCSLAIWYTVNAAAVTTVTATHSGSPASSSCYVFELPAAQAVDVTTGTASASTTSFNQTVTTTNAYDTVIHAAAMGMETSRNALTSSETEALTKQNIIYTGNASAGHQVLAIIEGRTASGAGSAKAWASAGAFAHITVGASFKIPQTSSPYLQPPSLATTTRAYRW